jgi:GrpB-like predicted nucleotidyltransferase (UPF0157 family)
VSFKSVERLQKFTEQKIGLGRTVFGLEPFNPKWKRLYSDEAYLIFDELRNESLRLYHCGSTSVQGLDAQPVIDILGSVSSLEVLDQQKKSLEQIGYEYKGEYGIKGRRFCVLYGPDKTIAYVHLHIFQHDNAEVEQLLLFRDHLRSMPESKETYLKHKRYLIEDLKISRTNYSLAKSDIIKKIQNEASRKGSPKKIVAIIGAAAGHKNTATFLRETYIENSIEVIDLNEATVPPFSYSNGSSDIFQMIIQKAINADLLVLATPVYWYAMSGAMKDFIDRFSDLLSGEHKQLGESLYGKKLQLVSTGYDLKLPLGFEVPFSGTAIYLGMDYLGAIYRSIR